MKTVGIICEYNPFHLGHIIHIEKTRAMLGEHAHVVCVMSGNYVQRGDFAIFNKQARAKAAVASGVDLVLEMPTPYALSSAEGFAAAGVHILDNFGICDYISFGSESGDIGALRSVAESMVTNEAEELTKDGLSKGLPYAAARQRAADIMLGDGAELLKSANNLLGVEYLKAIAAQKSQMKAMTVKRSAGKHEIDSTYSASEVRKKLISEVEAWELMPQAAAAVYKREIAEGRGPISMKLYELAMLSRLRAINDFAMLSGASEGLDNRFARFAKTEPSIEQLLVSIKTKRYAMSRIRRMLICACLGIGREDTRKPPPYTKVLAMNRRGMEMLRLAKKMAILPIITKPASARKIGGYAAELIKKEAAATDFYVLAYGGEKGRNGGQEWRSTPIVLDK